MRTDIHVGFFDVFIFLGIFQGILLSWFFIKNVQKSNRANVYQGLLLLSLSLAIFEEWLNNTGFIVRILNLTNFSESLNLAFGPLLYFYIRFKLNPETRVKTWLHFIPFLFWFFYLIFAFIQPASFKYNSYIETKHPDWEYLPYSAVISDDPLAIRDYVNQMTIIQLLAYVGASIYLLVKKFRQLGQSFFRTDNELLILSRNALLHFLILTLLFIATKIYFGMKSDVGGNLVAAYISLMIFITSYQALNRSEFFSRSATFLPLPSLKYQKSSLSEEDKNLIYNKIIKEMEHNLYFTNNLASLSGLSKQLNESVHHVSQVINEKMNRSFFEMLAYYRVEHAKKLISGDKGGKLTVEELAEIVGYNSKSSFNIAFKKYTSKTPSEFRKSSG